MGQYKFDCFIDPTIDRVVKVLNTAASSRPLLIEPVGQLVSEQILFQYPLNNDPNETNDSHWATRQLNDELQGIRAGHTSPAIPVNMLVRIVKPVTANPVGVRIA